MKWAFLNNGTCYRFIQNLIGGTRARQLAIKQIMNLDLSLDQLSILDIGCGVGDVLKWIPRKWKYTGIDVTESYIKLGSAEWGHRGLISWLGFKQVGFEYIRPQRSLGSTKYNFKKLYELAVSGITSFSILPLRFATACAGLSAVFAILVASWAVVDRYYLGTPPRGWTSIIVVLLGLGTIHFLL